MPSNQRTEDQGEVLSIPSIPSPDSKDLSSLEKEDSECIEKAEVSSSQIDDISSSLSPSHREYLFKRHGTLDLDPMPSASDADPYNWPTWKKLTNLLLVAFHACMATFTSSITPAYEDISVDLGVSLQRASYLTSLQIAILGGAPLFWKPLSNRYGRRPIFLLSTILSLVCNVGCAKSPTYASLAACRALTAFFISPAAAIGSAVVAETFFKKERARYMGIWTLMVTLGIPVGALIFGFVANRAGYRWIFWVLAITNGVQFILYIFFGPETRYIGGSTEDSPSGFKTQYLSFRRIDPTPLTFREFVHPLTMVKRPSVVVPAVVYAMVFLFGSVMITVEVPQLLQEKFALNTEQLGLQFIGVIVGTILGEQIGGSISDYWMNRRARRIRKEPEPEFRLWLSYPGIVLTIVGVIVFLVCTQQAPEGHWTVTPIVGTGVAAFGNQVVTTVMVTYAVDCHPDDPGSVGVFITFVRQIWGFIGPFWFPDMFANVGVAASSGVASAMIFSCSLLPTIAVHAMGRKWA
ncbi:major facilitator superfamily domain-containing protein [Aspergillus caelatus]|uniref:Major facilitator superfamily domain-containing protein n=1 Tax=Aspergillus caelatus TaxID=61420 RepID=A0A5N7A9U3_9EURO|nr:major facilitator superfamily domain-containing protein [Aspergillus caelatus]KAE8365360.1 major facilitator superfamily domain-containing protein [Aspergillus caelatus]